MSDDGLFASYNAVECICILFNDFLSSAIGRFCGILENTDGTACKTASAFVFAVILFDILIPAGTFIKGRIYASLFYRHKKRIRCR